MQVLLNSLNGNRLNRGVKAAGSIAKRSSKGFRKVNLNLHAKSFARVAGHEWFHRSKRLSLWINVDGGWRIQNESRCYFTE